MAQPMLQLRTAVGGSEPAVLEEGRLAVDVVGGKLYVGDAAASPVLISQSIAFSPAASTPVYPKAGHFWYETYTGNLNLYDGTAYQQVSGGGTSGDSNIDGGAPSSVYLPNQVIDGGSP